MSGDSDTTISSIRTDSSVSSFNRISHLPGGRSISNDMAVQTVQQSVGGGNIIVLNVENTKNLAAALNQIASNDFAKQGNLEQRVPLEAAVRNHLHPEQRQSTAAFMLVPLPPAPSMHITLPSDTVAPDHNQSCFSATLPGHVSEPDSSTSLQNHKLPSSSPCSHVPSTKHVSSLVSQDKTPSTPCGRSALHPDCIPTHSLKNCSGDTDKVMQHTPNTSWCGDPLSHTINHKTTVSSPGLAFLAQVSSLATDQKEIVKTTTTVAQNLPGCSPDHGYGSSKIVAQSSENIDCASPRRLTTILARTTDNTDNSVKENGDTTTPACPDPEQDPMTRTDFKINYVIEKRKKEMPLPPFVREKKKKGPAPKLSGNEVCLICGDRASGFHYNTLSCEGCKGFFRRSVIKNGKYQCKQKGVCTMDLYMRRKCQKCRFDKCKAAGMREESVLSEEKVKAKKIKKERETRVNVMDAFDNTYYPKLTPQQRSLLELLEANERRFQWPTSEDVKKVTVWVEGDDTPHGRALRFAHFTELCILIVQLVVEFTKQLPGFLSVPRDDQIVLLKACAIEVLLLRAAKQYNKHDGTINFLNGKLYDKSSFYKAGMQVEFVDPIFKFCNSMAQLDLDETEYAILVAINTFSTDRPHIKDIGKVECMQEPYVELLRVYSRIKHPDDPLMFARILMKIVELRTLNNYHSEQIFALKVQDRKLPPLLAEIWDM